MRFTKSISICNSVLLCADIAAGFPRQSQYPITFDSQDSSISRNCNVSARLFAELEEFARLVDIAYCVGVTGIQSPFQCANRCDDFQGYQLVDTWNTGPLMSDSCGYIVLDHGGKRIIVAFRGTYSITNTIFDLATIPQEYVPYPGGLDDSPEKLPDPEDLSDSHGLLSRPWSWYKTAKQRLRSWLGYSKVKELLIVKHEHDNMGECKPSGPKCENCTVHMGFYSSWKDCRRFIIPQLEHLYDLYPSYTIHLVGHSLGGAVAALAALEIELLGWHPTVTTFGEPRIGNSGLRDYLNELFELSDGGSEDGSGARYRRMTHVNDPVPLLPLTEWGYKMHSGEIYISKSELQPSVSDLRLCDGDEDVECIFGGEAEAPFANLPAPEPSDGGEAQRMWEQELEVSGRWGFPVRYRIWQLFFAHRDYFWRLGLCVPGGDPMDRGKGYDHSARRNNLANPLHEP